MLHAEFMTAMIQFWEGRLPSRNSGSTAAQERALIAQHFDRELMQREHSPSPTGNR